MIQSREARRGGLLWPGVSVVAILLSIGLLPASAQELDRCVRAWVAYPIVLPDGGIHEPGVLELCLRGKSPANGRHEIRVNGTALGQWPSRIGHGEETDDSPPVVVLNWTPEARLRLIGYTSPEHGGTVVYLLDSRASGKELRAREPTLRDLLDRPEPMVLLADAGG